MLDASALELAYGPDERAAIARRVDLVAPPQTHGSVLARPELLREVDAIFSGWGAPVLDQAFLAACPNLGAVFYAAGAVGSWMTDAAWARGVAVSSAIDANAIPVAEYTLATILFSLKHGWRLARETRRQRTFVGRNGAPGCYDSTVGLVSLGATARALCRLLRPFQVKVIAYDPYATDEEAVELGVELTSLEDVFRRGDVVSLHTPLLDETEGMITGAHLASMKRDATFINTARGELVREREMIEVLRTRTDLEAVLDVTAEEPPAPQSPLYTMPNVMLTPHIAGSVGRECRRMGRWMVEELDRYLKGEALRWRVTPEMAAYTSHRPTTRSGGARPVAAVNGNGNHKPEQPQTLAITAA